MTKLLPLLTWTSLLLAAEPAVRLNPFAADFSDPVQIVAGPGEPNIFYVVEQAGRIVRYDAATKTRTHWLDLHERVTFGGEAGLLGLAFHPKYAENGRYFLAYTAERPDFSQLLVELKRDGGTTEKVLLRVPKKHRNHNGSQVQFGPDGFLYLSTGDGGSANDPDGNGQNKNVLLGKILRLDVDGGQGGYRIPKDNPFANGGGRPEIFAYGVRNVWRFSFDSVTGDLWGGDVGQNREEEIDVIRRGQNYGWNVVEGKLCFRPATNCQPERFVSPIVTYGRKAGISVTGGYVYRGKKIPGLVGAYVYGDFGSGTIWAVRLNADKAGFTSNEVLLKTSVAISAFGEDADGEILVVGYDGAIQRLEAMPR